MRVTPTKKQDSLHLTHPLCSLICHAFHFSPAVSPTAPLDSSMPMAPWNAPNGWVVWFANWTKTISKFAWGTLRHLNACSNKPSKIEGEREKERGRVRERKKRENLANGRQSERDEVCGRWQVAKSWKSSSFSASSRLHLLLFLGF